MVSELCLNRYDKVANRFSNQKNPIERALKEIGTPQKEIDSIMNKMCENYHNNLRYLKEFAEINQEVED